MLLAYFPTKFIDQSISNVFHTMQKTTSKAKFYKVAFPRSIATSATPTRTEKYKNG